MYLGKWQGDEVAVKVVEHQDDFDREMGANGGNLGDLDIDGEHGEKADSTGKDAAVLEAAVMRVVKHPNVVETYEYRNVVAAGDMTVFTGLEDGKQ